jgi:hypothetical protein
MDFQRGDSELLPKIHAQWCWLFPHGKYFAHAFFVLEKET